MIIGYDVYSQVAIVLIMLMHFHAVSAYNHLSHRIDMKIIRSHGINHRITTTSKSALNCNNNQVEEDNQVLKPTIDISQIWSSRRKISKVALSPFVGYAIDRAKEKQMKEEQLKKERGDADSNKVMEEDDDSTSNNQGLVVSAFIIAITAVALRLGGRGAFVQLLGLDFITDSDIKVLLLYLLQ